jgi:hypothetical protein
MNTNSPSKALLVDRHLYSDVRKLVVLVSLGVWLDGY